MVKILLSLVFNESSRMLDYVICLCLWLVREYSIIGNSKISPVSPVKDKQEKRNTLKFSFHKQKTKEEWTFNLHFCCLWTFCFPGLSCDFFQFTKTCLLDSSAVKMISILFILAFHNIDDPGFGERSCYEVLTSRSLRILKSEGGKLLSGL